MVIKTSINPDTVLRNAQDKYIAQDVIPGCSFPSCKDAVLRNARDEYVAQNVNPGCSFTSCHDAVLCHTQDDNVGQDVKPGCSFTSCPGRQAQMQFCKSNLVVFHNSCNQYLYSIFISSDEVVALLFTLNMHMW